MFKCTNTRTKKTREIVLQRGSALIIALVFLLALTMIGTTAMQGTSQQEKMASNMRDRNLAFQAAEAALRAGEQVVDPPGGQPPAATAFGTTPGLITVQTPTGDLGAFWRNYFDNNPSITITNNLTQLTQQPQYIIEEDSATTSIDPACGGSVGAGVTPPRCFRITVRATGGTTDAVVILQSTYVRP